MTKKKVLGLSIIALIILFIALSTIEFPPNTAAQAQYWAAQDRLVQEHIQLWAEQKISKYQMKIHWTGYPEDCQQEFMIEKHLSHQISQNTCAHSSSSSSVDVLFSYITRLVDNRECGANGCGCDGPFIMDVIYDERYGFPKIAKPAYHPDVSWMFRKSKIIELPFVSDRFCTLLGNLYVGWEIDSFLPLQ